MDLKSVWERKFVVREWEELLRVIAGGNWHYEIVKVSQVKVLS